MKNQTIKLLIKRRYEIIKNIKQLKQEKKLLNSFLKGNGVKRAYKKHTKKV